MCYCVRSRLPCLLANVRLKTVSSAPMETSGGDVRRLINTVSAVGEKTPPHIRTRKSLRGNKWDGFFTAIVENVDDDDDDDASPGKQRSGKCLVLHTKDSFLVVS